MSGDVYVYCTFGLMQEALYVVWPVYWGGGIALVWRNCGVSSVFGPLSWYRRVLCTSGCFSTPAAEHAVHQMGR
jgi:hypothetical protein